MITDALGRQQVLSQPYYSGTSLLRQDLAEYSVELGSVRQDYGTRSFGYGDMIGVASYRRGLTDTLTGGTRAEARPMASTRWAPTRRGRPGTSES